MNSALKILLVDPYGWQGGAAGNKPYPNVGLAYIAAALKRHDYKIKLIDMNNNNISEEQFLSEVKGFSPDIVGISVKTATMKAARTIGSALKSTLPSISIVVGGPHPTIGCISQEQDSWIDAIIAGEGDVSFIKYCENYLEGCRNSNSEVNGTINAGQSKLSLTQDLDSLPFPDYDFFSPNILEAIKCSYPLVTSRGCPYQCIYCSVPLICGNKIRKRSPENVISELKSAIAQYGITAFEVIDDAFNVDIKRCKEICSLLIAERMNLDWSCPNGLRADSIDEELAELMFRSGCKSVMIGVETADPLLLASLRKGETIEAIATGIEIFKSAGISVGGYFIIGLPGDSYQSQEKSVDFVKKMQISAHFNMLVPYPGTELWGLLTSESSITGNIEDSSHFASSCTEIKPVFETNSFNKYEAKRIFEMVHTRLGNFNSIVPLHLGALNYYWRILMLMLRYDRKELFNRIISRIAGRNT